MAAANGQLNEGFDSDDDAGALFFDNNDLANRIWEEEQVLDGWANQDVTNLKVLIKLKYMDHILIGICD